MKNIMSRRHFLQASTMAAALVTGPRCLRAEEGAPGELQSPRSETFRFAHLTDIHVKPELRAEEGLVQCLSTVMRLDPRPDFIDTGGDLVMDVFKQDEQRARSLFVLLKKVLADHTDLPVHHCIGNHDVFAWGKSGVDEKHPAYGKRMVLEYLDLPDRYYRFDHKGFRFFVLDDIQPAPDQTYQAYIDDTQMAWLEEELQAKPAEMPAVAVCHIPILM
jgi:3',5'-cyclic AMP phosphodiesterase CpdA